MLLSVIGDRNAKKDDEIEAKSEIVRRFCCFSVGEREPSAS
jgi:hypothetical protein